MNAGNSLKPAGKYAIINPRNKDKKSGERDGSFGSHRRSRSRKEPDPYYFKGRVRRTNDCLHPLVWDQIRSRISEKKDRLTAVEAALFDEKSREICDCLLFVDTDEETRIRRLIENRGYSRGQCLAVMRNQPDSQSKLKLTHNLIDNNGTEEDVKRQLSEVMKEISTNETC